MPTAKQLAQSLAALAQVGDADQCNQLLQRLSALPVPTQRVIRQAALASVRQTPTGMDVLQAQLESFPLPSDQDKGNNAQGKQKGQQSQANNGSSAGTETDGATGRIELMVKFGGIPKSRPDTTGRTMIEVQCDKQLVYASVKNKSFNKFLRSADEFENWAGALSGKLGKVGGGRIELLEAGVQCFEKKPKNTDSDQAQNDQPQNDQPQNDQKTDQNPAEAQKQPQPVA
jgi:hypothetical protein